LSASIATGLLVGGALKYFNPADIDVWQPLAYLSETLFSALAVMIVLLAIAVFCIYRLRNQADTPREAIRLPIFLLIINFFLIGLMIFTQQIEKAGQDNWARANNQPTHAERNQQLDEFFEKQKDN